MNKVEQLIKKYCPNGVPKVALETVLDYIQPSKYIVKSTDYDNAFTTPVLTAGKGFILGYTNETTGIYQASKESPTIIFDDFVTSFHWVDFSFKVKSSAMKLLVPKTENVCFRFIYYAMKCIHFVPTEHTRHWISRYSKFEIPLPPLNVQQEIVSILDTFTDMIDNLNEELELKQKQMLHYSDVFFGSSVDELVLTKDNGSVNVVPISELGSITRGKRFVRDDVREEGQPCIHYGDMYTYYGTKAFTARTFLDRDFPKKMRYAQKGDVIVVGAGENDWDIGVGMVWLGEEPAAVHDACYILEHHENAMYISYYLRSTVYHLQLRKYVSSGKISSFSGDGLGKVLIPLPSSDKQAEIVSILDTFEDSIQNIKAEIELRQKQYEYYREKLLTFE